MCCQKLALRWRLIHDRPLRDAQSCSTAVAWQYHWRPANIFLGKNPPRPIADAMGYETPQVACRQTARATRQTRMGEVKHNLILVSVTALGAMSEPSLGCPEVLMAAPLVDWCHLKRPGPTYGLRLQLRQPRLPETRSRQSHPSDYSCPVPLRRTFSVKWISRIAMICHWSISEPIKATNFNSGERWVELLNPITVPGRKRSHHSIGLLDRTAIEE